MNISRRTFLGAAALGTSPAFLESLNLPHRPMTVPSGEEVGKPASSPVPNRDRFDPWVEIIPKNLKAATAEVRRLAKERPVLAVVKNNGYGLGIGTVGSLLEDDPGILGFAVVKGEEALDLRSAGVQKPILLMGMFAPEEGPELAKADVEFAVFTPDASDRLLPLARSLGRPLAVHFYLDTGMGRMGMSHRKAVPWMTELAPLYQCRSVF